jgi:hypothetical protein
VNGSARMTVPPSFSNRTSCVTNSTGLWVGLGAPTGNNACIAYSKGLAFRVPAVTVVSLLACLNTAKSANRARKSVDTAAFEPSTHSLSGMYVDDSTAMTRSYEASGRAGARASPTTKCTCLGLNPAVSASSLAAWTCGGRGGRDTSTVGVKVRVGVWEETPIMLLLMLRFLLLSHGSGVCGY